LDLRIALLEDDPAQSELMRKWLAEAGHDCSHYATGRDFLRAISRETYDLALLDWELPDMNGDEVLPALRAKLDWSIPVLCITVRDQENDVVGALELGADDYMSKPVSRAEMFARIDALLRRTQPARNETSLLDFSPYVIDPTCKGILRNDKQIPLAQKEFDLAYFLFLNAGRLLSRNYILESVWGTRGDLNTRTVDTHVSRIRAKLALTPDTGWRLRAIYRHGYRLERLRGRET
jgi:DNA-binding response OmpR family regulator